VRRRHDPPLAFPEHDIIAVDGFEPVVQQMQDGFCSWLVVGVPMQQLPGRRGGLADQSCGHVKAHLRPFHLGAGRIERRSAIEGRCRAADIAEPPQQVAAMDMVFGVCRDDGEGAVDRRQGGVAAVAQQLIVLRL